MKEKPQPIEETASALGKSWRRLLGSLTIAGLVSANSGCAQDAATTRVPDDPRRNDSSRWQNQRLSLVNDLRRKGIRDERVLAAVLAVPRHEFVPQAFKSLSYEDGPLPIGLKQTISQPFIVAFMTEALKLERSDRVLEIGTGSGYQAAVLSQLVDHVYSIEILDELSRRARQTFTRIGVDNVSTRVGDGYKGWKENAPYDAIIVTAAPKSVPEELTEQLAEGGRLIIPVGETDVQWLLKLTRANGKIIRERMLPVRFVPLVHGNK